jgi:Kef-type K+ transport system membrane component KefB
MIDWLFVLVIALAFIAVLISAKVHITTGIIELILGIVLASILLIMIPSFSTEGHPWLEFLGGLGALAITFLAGAALRTQQTTKLPWKLATHVSIFSFAVPFIGIFVASYYIVHWDLLASLLMAVALAETSVAITYVVLVENGLTNTSIGKIILTSTFITNLIVVVALTLILGYPNIINNTHVILTLVLLVLAWWILPRYIGPLLGESNRLNPTEGRLGQREVMVIILILISFGFVAELGAVIAVFPAYILGFILGPKLHGIKGKETLGLTRFRTITFALLSPIFFIGAGMRASFDLVISSISIITLLVFVEIITKYIPVRIVLNKLIKEAKSQIKEKTKEVNYASWLLATGLTWGTITAILGFSAGIINEVQFAILESVVILTAIIPSVIAEKFYRPKVSA